MSNILFRADSSSVIGTGHIMRDLVLASRYKDANIVFAVQDLKGNINHAIAEAGHSLKILRSNDIKELDTLIKTLKTDMIVIDNYGIDAAYEKELKIKNPALKILSFDDTYEKHCCDILLNHNISADEKRYKGLVPEGCELRCGAAYTLLRDEFMQEKQKAKKPSSDTRNKNIFISMGGADHSNISIEILEVLDSFPHLHAHVVTTTANAHLQALKEYVHGKDKITLHINTKQIARLMHEADAAIVTPSVTLNEVIYMDLPFIAIKTAENQQDMYRYLSKNNYSALEEFDAIKLKSLLEIFAIEILNFTDLSLDDKKIVLKWRNHPSIKKWMFTQDEIGLTDHLSFIDSLKKRIDKVYFLVKKDSIPIGVIDFTDIDKKSAEFGIYANPNLKGVGRLLMRAIIDYAFNVLKIGTLKAEVLKDNLHAIKLYKEYNFAETNTKNADTNNLVHMELKNENR
ncbi:MAG: UDP-2,4-diacetamido-2,4,6-trideoxy-beta-L-altropyranose hydrolase [Campylobacterales bacterium]|nr:UDP-2,4-diacetamido-2,4,6-trideoxy-beta-L-altropyranose hydrolase [Campylobacterales bacterium]